MNISKIRGDFDILQNKSPPIYFDNACMTLKPRQVIEKMDEYYTQYPACAGRSNHRFGTRASEEYANARTLIKKFTNASSENEIIFTRNTTEGINLVASSLEYDVVMTTDKEHNSNHVPFLRQHERHGIIREIISTKDGFDMEQFETALKNHKDKSVLCSFVHTSNLDGTTNPIREIAKLAHSYDAIVMIDGAQSVPHRPIDVRRLGADLIAFSGHKMLGPTGTGVLYARQDILRRLGTYNVGGDTVRNTTYTSAEYEDAPQRFEAGLQDYAGFIGLGEAARYLSKHIDEVEGHDIQLNSILTEGLSSYVDIIGPQDPKKRGGIFSFNAKNKMDHHEIALMLDSFASIMIRSGRHCVHSWFNANNIEGSARASFYLYNTEDEARIFVERLREILGAKG